VEAIPWFKVYPAETLSDELFSGWSIDERGAWFTLILVNWREGSIPSDQATLARLLHVDGGTMRSLWSAIGSRFVRHPDLPERLTSPRVEREREAAQRLMDQKVEAGRKGATSRWAKEKVRNGSRMGLPCEANATAMANDSDKERRGEEREGKDLPAAEDEPVLLPTLPPKPASPFVTFLRETYPDIRDPWASESAWLKAFPGVDLLAEALKARAWETSDPKRQKTSHGRFLNGWFGRAQDDASKRPQQQPRRTMGEPGKGSDFDEAPVWGRKTNAIHS
jgi:hypothetical protein